MTNPLKVEEIGDLLKLYDVNYENNVYEVESFLEELKESKVWGENLEKYKFLPEGFFEPIKENFPDLTKMLKNYNSALLTIFNKNALPENVLVDVIVLLNECRDIYDKNNGKISREFAEKFASFYEKFNEIIGQTEIDVRGKLISLKDYLKNNKQYLHENIMLQEKLKEYEARIKLLEQSLEEYEEYKEKYNYALDFYRSIIIANDIIKELFLAFYSIIHSGINECYENINSNKHVNDYIKSLLYSIDRFLYLPLNYLKTLGIDTPDWNILKRGFEEGLLEEKISSIIEFIEENDVYEENEKVLKIAMLRKAVEDFKYLYKVLFNASLRGGRVVDLVEEIRNFQEFSIALSKFFFIHQTLIEIFSRYWDFFDIDEEEDEF